MHGPSPTSNFEGTAPPVPLSLPPWPYTSLPSFIHSFWRLVFDHLHWLPLIDRIQLEVLTLIYRSHIGQAPRNLRDHIRLPSSATSPCPPRSLDSHDLFVPRARTSVAQTRAFSIIGNALWNQL